MPLHELKIDRSFVEHLPHDANAVAIVDSVLGMAHNLNLSVVAEGVESEGHAAFPRDRKCEILQGYYFSRPLAADHFRLFVAATMLEGTAAYSYCQGNRTETTISAPAASTNHQE